MNARIDLFSWKGLPKWDMNMCKASPQETAEKAANCEQVPIPDYDPIYGFNGHLPKAWRAAASHG